MLLHTSLLFRTGLEPKITNDKAATMLKRECEFLKSLQHSHVVKYLSAEKHPTCGDLILVMELMDCNLITYLSGLEGKSLTNLYQVSLSKDVASGLAYIHSIKVIHRDLCGDNVLLTLGRSVPVAKISDFGMARLLDPLHMSHTLSVIGSRFGYMPPEAAPTLEHQLYDYSLDVFSLGAIMIQIVCQLKTVATAKDRNIHFSKIPTKHRLKHIICKCLQNKTNLRPLAKDICESLLLCVYSYTRYKNISKMLCW